MDYFREISVAIVLTVCPLPSPKELRMHGQKLGLLLLLLLFSAPLLCQGHRQTRTLTPSWGGGRAWKVRLVSPFSQSAHRECLPYSGPEGMPPSDSHPSSFAATTGDTGVS